MNEALKTFAKENFPNSKNDLFAMFIERTMSFICKGGFLGLMTPFTWMFIASFEKIRKYMLKYYTITTLIKPEYNAFWDSAHVSICAFVLFSNHIKRFHGSYIELANFYGAELQPIKALEAIKNPKCGWFFNVTVDDLEKIPGHPIAFWVSERVRDIYTEATALSELAEIKVGMHTGSNDLFVRYWYEVDVSNIGFSCKDEKETELLPYKWYPYNKGGDFRKWYGNRDSIVNWKHRGKEIHKYHNIPLEHNGAPVRAKPYQFKESLTWSFITSSYLGVRYSPPGSMFDVGGSSVFPDTEDIYKILGFLCSKLSTLFIKAVNSTVNYQVGNVATLPIIFPDNENAVEIPKKIISMCKEDWDSFETSWDFTIPPLLKDNFHGETLNQTFKNLRIYWKERLNVMLSLETTNNLNFIDGYRLQNEISPDASPETITVNFNPRYRYGSKKSEEELEALLLTDTMKEFISYAVGCMFGRYSLNKPGLVLACQGETKQDYYRQVPRPNFLPDEDNVITIMEAGWFSDDLTERFKKFLRVTFGDEHYEENLSFLENAIGRDIRSYFLKDFYSEHVRMYKNRPIYWLFSSPNGSFNALIYMHRYRPDTVSVILNDYLREYVRKLNAHKAHLEQVSARLGGSQAEKAKATKEINTLNKVLAELKEYEDEVLYPLATRQIQIDLDDGVKVNYKKFGKALKSVKGLSA